MTLDDLKPFCSIDETLPYLRTPFTDGEYTYATNGCLMVRVPRIEEAPVMGDGIGIASARPLFQDNMPDQSALLTLGLPPINRPAPTGEMCEHCEGRGHYHDCPSCTCKCEACEGAGLALAPWPKVKIGEAVFDGKYIALMQRLGALRVVPRGKEPPMYFTFEGGEGLVMPRRSGGFEIKARLT